MSLLETKVILFIMFYPICVGVRSRFGSTVLGSATCNLWIRIFWLESGSCYLKKLESGFGFWLKNQIKHPTKLNISFQYLLTEVIFKLNIAYISFFSWMRKESERTNGDFIWTNSFSWRSNPVFLDGQNRVFLMVRYVILVGRIQFFYGRIRCSWRSEPVLLMVGFAFSGR